MRAWKMTGFRASFFFKAEDGIRDYKVTGVQTCALPISTPGLCRELNKPVVVEEVTVEPPRRGEVTVKLGACGVCHSDLSATNGTIPMPPPLIQIGRASCRERV